MEQQELIYDWNALERANAFPTTVEVCDETLRDGLQSPSVRDPKIEDKFELITLMDELGITIANIGLPGAGPRAFADVLAIAHFVKQHRLNLMVNCAARTVRADIEPIATIQQRAGIAITAYCFLGTSPIRQTVENWDLDKLKATAEEAIKFAHQENLKVAFVTEDTTRSNKATLGLLFNHAIGLGVERLVLCDTVGYATPDGVKALVGFTKNLIKDTRQDVKIDWHGHNDRGLAVANALCAAQYGCHRLHGTALGIGERVGNTALDQLIVNLKLEHAYPHGVSSLSRYVETVSRVCRTPIPANYPVFGSDAFRTATGVHASAVIKAQQRHDDVLANTVYSGVPAHWFGKAQVIEIGPMSGASNVKHWLSQHSYDVTDDLVKALLNFAKNQAAVLTEAQLKEFLAAYFKNAAPQV
ncbi:MAG TPA: LeuA family protein [Myxococcota bacterium]|nr:LeuA family protein [Myxococcota bacterium]